MATFGYLVLVMTGSFVGAGLGAVAHWWRAYAAPHPEKLFEDERWNAALGGADYVYERDVVQGTVGRGRLVGVPQPQESRLLRPFRRGDAASHRCMVLERAPGHRRRGVSGPRRCSALEPFPDPPHPRFKSNQRFRK